MRAAEREKAIRAAALGIFEGASRPAVPALPPPTALQQVRRVHQAMRDHFERVIVDDFAERAFRMLLTTD